MQVAPELSPVSQCPRNFYELQIKWGLSEMSFLESFSEYLIKFIRDSSKGFRLGFITLEDSIYNSFWVLLQKYS